ncbi:Biotin transporter BioY [Phycisphaerae bacterium RAS1]|nr:Biotin transporter BioY [Phycisphaerae bacterium RAS1]
MNTRPLAITATVVRPVSLLWIRALSICSAALLTALAAQIVIPLPNTPVPMTLQTLMVLLTGALLGPALGAAGMGVYLLVGALGLPVFSMGRGGVEMIMAGATGGYLVGFLVAQPLLGWMSRPGSRYSLRLAASFVAAHAVIFGCGLTWLALHQQLTPADTLAKGLFPFLGDLLAKCVLALGVARCAAPAVRRIVRA